MDRTRSGRTVKKSIKYISNSDEDLGTQSDDLPDDFSDGDYSDEYQEEIHEVKKAVTESRNLKRKCTQMSLKEDGSGSVQMSLMSMLGRPHQTIPKNELHLTSKNFKGSGPPPTMNAKKNDDQDYQFYKCIQKMLNGSEFIYPDYLLDSSDYQLKEGCPVVNICENEMPKFKFDPKLHSLHSSSEKVNEKIKEIIGIDMDVEELQKYNRISSYFLYNIVSKKKAEALGQLSSHTTKDYTKLWTKMPERTRRDWEIKTNRIKKQIEDHKKREHNEVIVRKEKREASLKKAEENIKKAKLDDFNLVDIAGYFKSISNGLGKMATDLQSKETKVLVQDAESKLLDFLLSTMVCMIALFEENEGLDRPVPTDSLNKLTFILPHCD